MSTLPQDWFLKIKEEVVEVFPDLADIIFVKCDEIAGNVEDYRAFMHTFHIPNAICHAEQAKDLPDANIEGILWHEFGHLIAGEDGDECDADVAVFEEFGIELGYDDKDLQFVKARHEPMGAGMAEDELLDEEDDGDEGYDELGSDNPEG